jgi:hypothetical protein
MAEEHKVESPHSRENSLSRTDPIDERNLGKYIGSVALVGLGVALIEVELIPGMLIGVAAMMFPKLAPRLGNVVRPLVKSAVRAGVVITERARETVAEATEQVQDIVAEVRAEYQPAYSGHPGAGSPDSPDARATKTGAHRSGSEKAGGSTEAGTEEKQEPKEAARPEESGPRGKRT